MKWKRTALAVAVFSACLWAQNTPGSVPVGKIVPKIVCSRNEKQSYALYLPNAFLATRRWPIIYVFDPGGRGEVAVETLRSAAEKYGYILVGSNNSKNGPQGGASEAAQAMWLDTQQRFPLDESRRYFAGMSGGARVATALAQSCHGCVAGVIANAAGFSPNAMPNLDTKFAYFAAVGNADMNYPEFVDLRVRLDALGIAYRIRIFDGEHGWAPPDVWDEALNWMDLQAMARGLTPRDAARIDKNLGDELARARNLEAKREWLGALRGYQAITRDFTGLADISAAKNRVAELEKDKEVARQEKQEKEDAASQNRVTSGPSAQMEMIASGNLDSAMLQDLRHTIAGLKHDASRTSKERERLVLKRALGALVIQAFESSQRSMEQKDFRNALTYLDVAAAGSEHLGWVHFQRARAYAGLADKNHMLDELKQSLAADFHPPTALDTDEFTAYRQDPKFEVLAREWAQASHL
jgi:hypothetical protein